jgi:DNA polymerase I-like protein with 3'-5' exonuclease and polymerase domains
MAHGKVVYLMSRFTNDGLFWKPVEKKIGGALCRERCAPPIPDTGWTAPRSFPNLRGARALAIDVETYDPDLTAGKGPGWARKTGYLVGVSVATDDGHAWYFPMRHTVQPETNLDADHVRAWLSDTLGDERPKVGANLIYDVPWLENEGVRIGGELYDVQYAEALLSEDERVGLDVLAAKYLGLHKESTALYQWSRAMYGGSESAQRANIWRAPPCLVGPYGEADALLPMQILKKQLPFLQAESLFPLFRRENALTRLLIKMRRAGVRVDLDAAEKLRDQLRAETRVKQDALIEAAGMPIEIYAAESIAAVFDRYNLAYPRTKTGKPSFTKNFLESNSHPIAKSITEIRQLDKLASVFIQSYLIDNNVDGFIHCEFHPLRGDTNGTRSGRLSASHPNLQNIPKRTALGKTIRKLFIPDDASAQWRKYDASQIEYRMLAHFAIGAGSDEVRRAYQTDPKTDFHKLTQRLIFEKTNKDIPREPTKNINFGFIYGMQERTLAKNLNLVGSAATELFEAYHAGAPYVKATFEHFKQFAADYGYVETITHRKSRFNDWVPNGHYKSRPTPVSYDEALMLYGGDIKRAFTHKATNRVFQGSAADIMKEGMLQCYEAGLFDVDVPRITVHDELDFSDADSDDTRFLQIQKCLEHAIEVSVPILYECSIGKNWGAAA